MLGQFPHLKRWQSCLTEGFCLSVNDKGDGTRLGCGLHMPQPSIVISRTGDEHIAGFYAK
jgi:hypothetical protein